MAGKLALKSPSLETIELATRHPLPPSVSTFNFSTFGEDGDEEVRTRTETALASDQSENENGNRNESSLAPVDRGFGVWSFLTGAFLVEAIVWGFPNAFGVFLNAYLEDPNWSSQPNARSLLPLIGTLSSGIIYCSGPVIYPITTRYPYIRRIFMWCGTLMCCASLFGASYATTVKELVVLQGVMYAIGGSLLYSPCLSYLSEWFVARRGLANGVIFAGTALGGLLLPLLLPPLLHAYGPAKSLRILAISTLIALLPILPFIRGRLPEVRTRVVATSRRREGWMWDKMWWILIVANTVQGFGYFVPIIWLPTFASELKISDSGSALTISLLNGASVVGRLSLGFLSDKIDPWLLALTTLLSSSLATFLLWGVFSHSLGGLLAFGIAYGCLAGGWSSLYTSFIRPIAKDDPALCTSLLGILMFFRGLGNVLSTPISTSLSSIHTTTNVGYNSSYGDAGHMDKMGFDVAGGKYEKMILYCGSCFAGAAGIALFGWSVERSKSGAGR
ncbi:hypothetical protein JAAARDRAFT_30613 [Jaapia argillacea MUCL 33604]|uniref:Major facilitator superfamily (MFS) profile domain-containing protein n=1 Tax=Jaapia argillacea MUCL 33604 TaxID=933084 RepID=A0A067QGS1_9AGAM|nr:hypothetical protein JAAARDRAFT_30613 [Jaapia argillacea MUCL 33604]